MNHPFQCIETIRPSSISDASRGFLLAACGPKLLSVCLDEGTILSQWATDSQSAATTTPNADEGDERPAKKLKADLPPTKLPNVIKLTVSPDNLYVVAVTDDKCVRVFTVDHGNLEELSQRIMPKRPCAIQVLPDNATILCGDKFGDVYSLPLLPGPFESAVTAGSEVTGSQPNDANGVMAETSKGFKPSATNLTVHTQRNRKALEAQLKQQNLAAKTKKALEFEHKLLLGHVSMLTDLAYAVCEVDGKQRGHIITADRDEHIRVSRGPPQSHVIEGYCLGHTEFVSKVCPIPGTSLLVSGGGDDWLGVWEWPAYKLKHKIDLRCKMKEVSANGSHINEGRIAVSGIWAVSTGPITSTDPVILVACEKSPFLFILPILKLCDGNAEWEDAPFDGPILDVTSYGGTILVSLDVRSEGCIRIETSKLARDAAREKGLGHFDTVLEKLNQFTVEMPKNDALEQLLYGVEKLRKRGNQDEVEDEAG